MEAENDLLKDTVARTHRRMAALHDECAAHYLCFLRAQEEGRVLEQRYNDLLADYRETLFTNGDLEGACESLQEENRRLRARLEAEQQQTAAMISGLLLALRLSWWPR